MFKVIKQKIQKLFKNNDETQHEDLTKPIILGDVHIDGQLNTILTAERINDIEDQITKLEKTITFTIHEPIIYGNIRGYWAELNFNMINETTCEILIEMSIFMENWLDKKHLIKPDTRSEMETIGKYHTRIIIFNEPQNIYTILEIIKTASNEMAREEIRHTINQIQLQTMLKGGN